MNTAHVARQEKRRAHLDFLSGLAGKRPRLALLEFLPKRGVGAEVGVFEGKYSRRIFNVAKPKKLYLVDPWINSEAEEHQNSWFSAGSAVDMDKVYQDVVSAFAKEAEDGRVEIHRQMSLPFAATLEDGVLDFVYIDADHNYGAVAKDLAAYFSKVKRNGVICVDDYSRGGWWGDGVVRATNEFIGSHPVQLVYALDNQVVMKKIEYAER